MGVPLKCTRYKQLEDEKHRCSSRLEQLRWSPSSMNDLSRSVRNVCVCACNSLRRRPCIARVAPMDGWGCDDGVACTWKGPCLYTNLFLARPWCKRGAYRVYELGTTLWNFRRRERYRFAGGFFKAAFSFCSLPSTLHLPLCHCHITGCVLVDNIYLIYLELDEYLRV